MKRVSSHAVGISLSKSSSNCGSNWYVAGLNAEEKELKLTLSLPMLAGKQVSYYNDSPAKNGSLPQGRMQKLKVNAKGEAKVVIQPGGGLVLK